MYMLEDVCIVSGSVCMKVFFTLFYMILLPPFHIQFTHSSFNGREEKKRVGICEEIMLKIIFNFLTENGMIFFFFFALM